MSRLVRRSFLPSLLFCFLISIVGVAHAKSPPVTDSFDLQRYAGKVVYVDFWASWCGPCRASFPFMQSLQNEYKDELVIIAINVDESRQDALEFLESFDVSFNIVYDPQGELAEGFNIPGMPTSYLFDRDGSLLMRHIGYKRSHQVPLRQRIADAVKHRVNLATRPD